MLKGISINPLIGVGDGLQFSSVPENYFKNTGQKLVDISKSWFFDHNPYVVRDQEYSSKFELWNYPKQYDWPKPRNSVYLSNAELHACAMQIPTAYLIRPRLYKYENFPFEKREKILLHTHGKSHGAMPDYVIDHILKKYKNVYHIGLPTDPNLGIPKIKTPQIWDLVKVISECRMLIGVDSGPAWIGACFPDVIVKKIRCKWQEGYRKPHEWIPLEIENIHSHWDDRAFQIYNIFDDDIGFSMSYKKI